MIRPEAEAEMTEAFDWYEERLPWLGASFLLCVDAVFRGIVRTKWCCGRGCLSLCRGQVRTTMICFSRAPSGKRRVTHSMRPEPGVVYRVDLGISGKVRFSWSSPSATMIRREPSTRWKRWPLLRCRLRKHQTSAATSLNLQS
jgi:hypothetical protein